MRYGDGGGVDQAGRTRREQVRMQAAAMFAHGADALQVAAELEVSTKSAYQWRRMWQAGRTAALLSKGPPGPDRVLSDGQVRRLEQELDKGALAAGYADDRWTLARVAALIRRRCRRALSRQTVSVQLKRMGWSPQIPTHRATERDERAIATWRRYRWPALKGSRAGWARPSASPTSRV